MAQIPESGEAFNLDHLLKATKPVMTRQSERREARNDVNYRPAKQLFNSQKKMAAEPINTKGAGYCESLARNDGYLERNGTNVKARTKAQGGPKRVQQRFPPGLTETRRVPLGHQPLVGHYRPRRQFGTRVDPDPQRKPF